MPRSYSFQDKLGDLFEELNRTDDPSERSVIALLIIQKRIDSLIFELRGRSGGESRAPARSGMNF